MKHFLTLACAVLMLAGCGKTNFQVSSINPESDISAPMATASYEMYSWHTGLNWAYAVFETATKVSTFAEISQRNDTIIGTDEIIVRLSQLPRGTKVYWNLKRIKGFSLPDNKTIEKVVSAVQKAGINIEVIVWP